MELERVFIWLSISILGSLASTVVGFNGYEDAMLQNLYKRLAVIDNDYLLDDLAEPRLFKLREDQLPGLDGQTAAAVRDSEYIQHSSNAGSQGFIHMSGGAGEGQQHLSPDGSIDNLKEAEIPEVKSDESLPFYCHPPNPCPKGLTEKDNCQEDIPDTAEAQKEWISSMMAGGYCSCDSEHMFQCNSDEPLASGDKVFNGDKSIDDIVNKIIADREAATYMSGERRQTLVAKKSPRQKRSAFDSEAELKKFSEKQKKANPYLSGEKLHTVAKKG